MLKISNKLTHVFFCKKPIIAYCQNKNLKDITGDTTIENKKELRRQNRILNDGYCIPWFSKISNLCCKKVVPSTAFKYKVTLKIYRIFRCLNYSRVIYLFESSKCKTQLWNQRPNLIKDLSITEKVLTGKAACQHLMVISYNICTYIHV